MNKRRKKIICGVVVGLPLCILSFYFGICVPLGLYVNICYNWHELSSTEQKVIKLTSFGILEKILDGQYEAVWNSSHRLLQESTSIEQFEKTLQGIQPLLTQLGNAEFIDGRLATTFGYRGKSQPLLFGHMDVNSPDHLRAQSIPGAKKCAIAMIRIPSQPITRTVSLQMAKDKGQFRLFRFDITPSRFNGKNGKYYEQVAENFISKQNLMAGYVAYLMAVKLNQLGPTLRTGCTIKLEERLQMLGKTDKLANELREWELAGNNYTLFGISLVEARDGIFPRLRYLAHDELSDEATPKEAAALMEYVKTHYPELAELFDSILFEAYTENPVSPQKRYDCYRTVLDFAV